jgi:hypothetical protein
MYLPSKSDNDLSDPETPLSTKSEAFCPLITRLEPAHASPAAVNSRAIDVTAAILENFMLTS